MGSFRSKGFWAVSGMLCAVSGVGCTSADPAPSASSSAAAPPASQAQPAQSGSASAAASAASPGVDLDKRELVPFELDKLEREFRPARTPPEKTVSYQKVFRQLAGGKSGYCGAHVSGAVVCWGSVPAEGLTGAFVQAAVGDKFVCGLDNAGAVKCGPEGGAPSLAAPAPSAAASSAVAAAGSAAPAPSDSAAPAPADSAAPAPAAVKYKAIAAGPGHLCALDRDGHATCAGAGGACALPAAPADVVFRSVAVGTCHVCARESSGAVRCWAPEGTAAATPPAGLVAKEVAAGDGFSCAIDGKGALVCWGSAPAAPADLPAEIESVGARGGSLCVIAKGGALRCWGTLQVTQPGPFTAMTVAAGSVCANLSKEQLACFGSDASGQLAVPEDTSMLTVVDAGRNPEERAANKKRRADTFRELLGKLPERDAPIKLDRSTKVPIGAVVQDDYLPVLELANFNRFFPQSTYHNGFAVKAPGKKFRLVVMHDKATPKLMSFDEEGKRLGQLTLASYARSTPEPALFDCGDVEEEVVTESEIGADLKVTVTTTTVLESLGRVKNQEGKIQNFCKVRDNTEVYAVSPTGSIDKVSARAKVQYEKIADEACRGRWLYNPRNEAYTASATTSQACECRLKKVNCP